MLYTLAGASDPLLIAGIIQGITEWIPVSSTAQVMKFLTLAGIQHPYPIAISLHFGSLLAVLFYFFFRREKMEYLMHILILSIFSAPALLLKQVAESIATQVLPLTPVLLLVTAKLVSIKKGEREPNYKDAAIAGLLQSLAVFPGVSRSGIVLATLLLRGVNGKDALNLTFFSAVPALLFASLLYPPSPELTAPILAAFVAGILSLETLRRIMEKVGPAIFCLLFALLSAL